MLRRFGFLIDAKIVNRAPGAVAARTGLPLGMTAGDVAPVGGSVIRVSNLGCAACHAGVTYDADGGPLPGRAMPGMPNSSIDLEAYTLAIFRALRRFGGSDQLLPATLALDPEMSWRERASLRLLVLPLAQKRLGELAAVGGGLDDTGVVSISDLVDRVWRTSLAPQRSSTAPPCSPATAWLYG